MNPTPPTIVTLALLGSAQLVHATGLEAFDGLLPSSLPLAVLRPAIPASMSTNVLPRSDAAP